MDLLVGPPKGDKLDFRIAGTKLDGKKKLRTRSGREIEGVDSRSAETWGWTSQKSLRAKYGNATDPAIENV
jgi:hypothetical protein